MKILFISSLICAIISILAELVICLFGFDEAPTPWDAWDRLALGILVSILFWLGVTIWSGLHLRRKPPRTVALWVRIVAPLIAAGYVGAVLLGIFS